MHTDTETRIQELVQERVTALGGFVVEVKVLPHKIIVEFDKPTGVTINECAGLNRFLADEPSLADILLTHELEVSSPGLEKPFRVFEQYAKNAGRRVKVLTTEGIVHTGTLQATSANSITLLVPAPKKGETQSVHLEFSDIKETRLIITF